MVRSAIACVGLALLMVGCAGRSLVPPEQAAAIKSRDRALAPHAEAIQRTIRESGTVGALVFLDATDGHLVVAPGDTPADAWARHVKSQPERSADAPPVLDFVYRADIGKTPDTVTAAALREQYDASAAAAARAAGVAALEAELRDQDRRTEERIGALARAQQELAEALASGSAETRRAIAAVREEMQKALNALSEDLAAVRQVLLQTAKMGRLNHEMTVENANELRQVATASQTLTANAAKLADTMRQLSGTLASQLRELGDRLDSLQSRIGNIK